MGSRKLFSVMGLKTKVGRAVFSENSLNIFPLRKLEPNKSIFLHLYFVRVYGKSMPLFMWSLSRILSTFMVK